MALGFEPTYWPKDLSRRLGIGFVFAWFMIGGVAHFVFTDAETAIVPPNVPFARAWVLFTGVCEIAGALSLLGPSRLRLVAGWALIALTICVTPANVEMFMHAERYPHVGAPLLALRLAFQPVLILIIWFSTRLAKR